MKRKRVLVTLTAITALVFIIITISYGYWTDQLTISGEAIFEIELPIVNDRPAQEEELIEGTEEPAEEELDSMRRPATDDNQIVEPETEDRQAGESNTNSEINDPDAGSPNAGSGQATYDPTTAEEDLSEDTEIADSQTDDVPEASQEAEDKDN